VVKEVYGADTELNESVTSTSMVMPVRKPDTRRLAPAMAALTTG
jgi:phosphonate transport system ATP-binding protein